MIRHEFRKIFSRLEWWIVLLIGAAFALFGLFETNNFESFSTWNTIYPAPVASMLGYSEVASMLLVMLPLLATFPCAWYYYAEATDKMISIQASRSTRNSFYFSKVVVISVTAFITSVFPFLLNLEFSFIAYPMPKYGVFGNDPYTWLRADFDLRNVLFPSLFMNAPLLNALVIIFFIGLYGVVMAVLTYSISLYFRKNIVVTMAITTVIALILILIFGSVGLSQWVLVSHLTTHPFYSNGNISVFLLGMGFLILLNVILIWYKIVSRRDILA